ncbi:short-chain dehydrogenase [Prosthecochloris sp. ZM]|uniref:SDR family NAD(P)-dependent oxidoreductase n=1 Tax=unclassified Prosthecochloris TaxID=2632826 RepID=UPI000DF7D68A|nr:MULTISPECIES: SDR family NAD(P)-dependent oxidoreductase [unclassified Prosthecochloris]NEX12864.1 short-chain dehydrogenase [Prosthecochloris sp.]RDD29639.1 short-chain dehydrogenase [Prosthecochloris sp. ZM]
MKQGVACITGSTDGIGRAAAFELAAAGHTVVLHGRSFERLEHTRREIEEQTGNHSIHTVLADFTDLCQVRRMVDQLEKSCSVIDILINNAGVYMPRCQITTAGIETTFAVNHLAHFCLTTLLEPLLIESRTRVVNVSSVDHHSAGFSANSITGGTRYTGYQAYAFSKLCNVAFTLEHADRLRRTGVTVNTLDPGILATKLLHAGWSLQGDDVSCGAPPLLYLACSSKVADITGTYFENNHPAICSPIAHDPEIRRELWEISEEIVERNS